MRDFPAGDPFVSLVAPQLRAGGHAPESPSADALGVTPPAPLAFDALTDLFLGGSPHVPAGSIADAAPAARLRTAPAPAARRDSAAAPAPTSTPTTEILITGHLPVMVSAWVQQYARDRAAATGAPVALVDLRTGRAWVQVLDPRAAFIAEAGTTLVAALASVKRVARTWMVRVDENDESALRAAAPGAAITLLSGADQAATVGAYRALKRLAAASRPERVTIAIMGAAAGAATGAEPGGGQADHAVDRVAAAARSFLSIEVIAAPVSAKVDASVRPVTAFAGPLPAGGAAGAIKLLAEALGQSAAPVLDNDDDDDLVPGPVCGPVTAPTPPPPPAPTVRTSDPGAQAPLHVLVAGLEALPVRCPAAPGVKLASDAQGRLHLVSIDLADATTPIAPHVEQLLAASAWATENHELLRVAFPRLAITGDRPPAPVLHLAVDQPKRVRHLLDTAVRLHVLASTAAARGWVARPLN